jgi:nucleoside 2-deoxyribosyltransferase
MVPRVYIAAPFQMRAEAIELMHLLRQHEIDCTSRWLMQETDVSVEWANNDLQDVLNAHAVVAINPIGYHNAGTGGRHVEVGYALAHAIPVFVLGGKSNVFHELCMHVDHESVLISALHASPATFSYHHHTQAMRAMFARVHRANRKWWIDLETGQPKERNFGELLMLVVSELAEAMEGDRKSLPDDKLPQYEMRTVEIADALIRLFDMAGSGRYGEVADAFDDKMAYNACRIDHTAEHRLSQHGKKY